MKCPNCNSEMKITDTVLLSNPPKYTYNCVSCCQQIVTDKLEISFNPAQKKESFKLNFKKVNNLDELLWLLNEIDLHVTAQHPKYDDIKKRFS